MEPAKSVDDYIAAAPEETRARLEELRAMIKATVPDAQESISYAMPTYHYHGRLVYFALWKKHVGVYGISAPVLEAFKSELQGYVMSKGTIQFPLNEALPLTLIAELVKAQAKRNTETQKQ